MLRAIIGVDTVDHADSILRFLERLDYDPIAVELLNVVDASLPLVPVGAFSGPELIGEYADALRATGEATLKKAKEAACQRGFSARATLVYGPPALTLLDYATENKADMLCVHGTLRGPLGSVIYGSISRAITIGAKQTVLIAKGEESNAGPLRAVLAVDHSEYCDRCIDKLLANPPRGLAHVCVLHALNVNQTMLDLFPKKVLDDGMTVTEWLRGRVEEKNAAIVDRLKAIGIEAVSMVEEGHPNEVIKLAMKSCSAELVILGAHGHGFLERLVVGSTSLHQVVAEPYSALVIRA